MSNTRNKNLNRFLSILLVFCMIFSMIPNIFAADVNKTFNIKLTWDHTNNTSEEKPDSVNVIIKSASSETSSITSTIKKMTLSKDGDLNLDNDPNTWEFSFEAKVTSYHKYFYIYEAETSEATLGFYDCTGAITTSESVCNLNATCKYVTYYHQVEIIQKWIDNDNSYNQRPNSTPIKFLGKLTKYANDSTLKEINQNITINESEVVKTDNNTWVYTTATIQTRFPYIDISDYHLGNNYTTYVNFPTTADTVIANGLNKTTIVIEHKHDLAYDLNFSASWSDFSNYFNVRPKTITLDIYGTNDINDKENGEYLGTTQLTAANNYTVKDGFYFASEKYDYIYVKSTLSNYDKTNGEYSHPIVTITKPNNVHSSSQSITNIPLNLYQTATLTVNFTPDMVNAPDNMEIKKAYVDIIHKEKVIKTIELTPDSNGVWTKTDSIDVATTSIKAQLRLNDLQTKYTIPTIDINQTLKDSKIPEAFTVDISTEYIDLNKNVSFNITKTWDDFNNKYNERPEEITVNLYGSYKENQGKELIASQVISVEDDLDKDNNPNTWEYIISGIENKYNYYYAEEVIDNSTILGSYELSSNTIEENIITNNNVEENNLIEENNNQIAQPMAFYPDYICIYKTWDDQNNINNSRPEYIDISVYTNSEDNEETKSLWFKVRLFEDDYELLEDPNDFKSEFCYAYDWNFEIESFGYTLPDYIWVEEEIPAEGYKSTISTSTSSYRGNNVSIYVVNTYFAPVSYNVNLTNTYTAPPREVQFDIVKTWVDDNDKYHLRPTFIDVEIYGVETEGATTGGELIETVRLTYNNKIDSNTWKKRITELETDYEYFYVKEINGSSSYTTSISPVKKVTSFTTIVNNLQNNSGIAPLAGFEDFIYLNKIWDDNNNEKGKRPESIIINAYTDEAKTDLYFSLELTETTCTMLEDPYGLDLYGDGGWTAEGIFFSGAPDVPELYIEEVCDNYVSSAVVTIEESEEMMGTDTTITITNTYVENPPELYEVNVTNTVIPPERDVQFKINKIWDDQDNRFNERGPISIEVFGTNTEGATTNGTSLGSFTITESDSTGTNTWSKTSPVYSTNFKYFYIVETFNNASYTSTISPLTKLDPPDPVEPYSTEERESISLYAGMIQSYSIYVQKNWEDNDNAAGKRPEFVDINIYHYESEESYENKDLYCSLRLYEDDYEILDNPSGTITPGYGGEWSATLYAPFSDSESDYWVEEVPNPNYVSFEMYMPGMDRYDRVSWADITNTYYVETYEATITNTYAPPTEVIFNITKTWDDNNNAANLRPLDIQVKIYGTNTEGATTGGTLIDTVVLTNEDVSSTNANVWNKTVVLDADYDYFYVVELSSLGTELNTYTLTNNTVTEVNNTVQPSNEDDDSISLFSGLTNKKFSITKIWNDNDNALGLRPEEIILSVYYNDTDNESGKKLLCKAKLTATTFEIIEKDDSYIKDDINVRYKDDWCFSMRLNKSCPYYIWVEEENTSYYDMSYDTFYDLVDNLDVTVTNTLKELRTYNINLTNKLDSLPIKVTKIWRDEDNRYDTRPDSLDITVYQNGTVFEVITFTSANMIGGNINVWESTINVPKFDENGNEYIYTISEDENNLELGYYYYEPSINQSSLTATNVGVWLPPIDIDVTPEYSIIVGKEIIDENDEIATAEDFWKLKLNIDDTYEFPIVLKELEKVLSKGNTSMEEEYEGYTGNVIHGVLTNKGQLLFTNIKPGKYEISEIINQYFDFVGMEKIESTEGASLTYEDGKYYITLSGVTKDSESITVKVINRLEDERPFNDVGIKNNLFVIPERENIDHDQPQD